MVPVRLHGSGLTRVLPLDHITDETTRTSTGERMVATTALVCGFVPMRGTDSYPEDVVQLADEVVLAVDTADRPDADALARTLSHPARTQWTGITVRHDEPAEHLDLWLATTNASTSNGTGSGAASFGRLRVSRAGRDAGIADPALRWAGAALYAGGTLAYITARDHTDDAQELGITSHGPDSDLLTRHLRDLLQQWGRQRPGQPTITATRAHAGPARAGTDVLRDHTRLTVAW